MWKILFQCSTMLPEILPYSQVSPWDKREEANEKKLGFSLANSDHLALLQAYKVSTGSDQMNDYNS